MSGFGSFKGSAVIKKKGYGIGSSNYTKYAQMEREIERKEAEAERKRLMDEMYANNKVD